MYDSLEIRIEETQTTIPTPPSSPRTNLSLDKKIDQELTKDVSILTTTTSTHSHSKRQISSKYSHLLGVLHRMCKRQRYMIQDMERKKPQEFKAHAPSIIEDLFKNYVHSKVIHVHPPTTTSIEPNSSADLQHQLVDDFHSYHDEHQDDDAPPKGEKIVKRSKVSKSSKSIRGFLSKHLAKDSTSYVSKQQSQQQEWDAWEEESVIDEDEVIPKDETSELIKEFQNVDKHVATIFDRSRMEATLKDMLSNQFINAEEYAYHLEQSTNFMENQIYWNTEEKKYILSLHEIHAKEFPELDLEEKMNRWVQKEFKTFNEDARLSIQHWKDSWHKKQILMMRANDKAYSFSEADFKYLNKNDIKDLYYLCRSKKDFQLGIESYQIRVNLTAPTLTFPDIEEYAPYSIADKPQVGLIYLNSKDEKRVMYLVEIVKFYDATLEKVLKEVKLRMFESQFLKKPPLLSDLDQDIMKAYEREISKCLSHRKQMRRWESFLNGRPILPTMKRL
ncbi:hypothetical protein Tco_0459058 [Tanacetum coccineum]